MKTALLVVLATVVAVGLWSLRRENEPRVEAVEVAAVASAAVPTHSTRTDLETPPRDPQVPTAPSSEREPAAEAEAAAESAPAKAPAVIETAPDEPPAFDPLKATGDEIESRVLDPYVADRERVDLLIHLQYGEGLSKEVVDAMILLAQASADTELRADIWQAMDDCKVPTAKPALLSALQHDPSADVRSEAAESIGGFAEDPEVRAALEFAAANDPDPRVRKEAAGSLDDED